jgi:hypothetical protein
MPTPKSYTYATTGLVLGLLVGLILHDVLSLPDGWKFYLWLFLVGGAGAAGGFIVGILEPGETDVREAPSPASGEMEISTTMRFFALSDESSSELTPQRVTFPKPPQSPPDMELELLIDTYSDTARCNVIEGVLQKLSMKELVDRIVTEANNRAPKNAKNPQLRMSQIRSEGAIDDKGMCSDGWSFQLVDAQTGLGASAVSTHSGVSIHYFTCVTNMEPATRELPNLPEVLTTVYDELPELRELPLYLRYVYSDELLLYPQDMSFIVDVDPMTGHVRNKNVIEELIVERLEAGMTAESFSVDAVFEWAAGDEVEEESFIRAIGDASFADGLRTFEESAMLRAGRAVLAHHGPSVVRDLQDLAMDPDDGNDPKLEVQLLAHVPSGLAIGGLHELMATAPEDLIKSEAEALFSSYRKGERTLNVDPIGSLDFVASRRLMGKTERKVVPLRSTFALEEEILGPLEDEIGLVPTRRRLLSGDSHLVLEVYLRPDRGDTEALVVCSPLPVPCYILHIMGSAAETFAERTEKAGITYGKSTMLQDLRSTVPTRVHRAALYLSALETESPDGPEPLMEAYRKVRSDRNLRRAVILALALTPGDVARDFLEVRAADEDHEDHGVAREALMLRAQKKVDPEPEAEGNVHQPEQDANDGDVDSQQTAESA